MPESEEDKTKLEPTGILAGAAAAIAVLLIVSVAILLPGLYIKLWEWVY